jgi:DNA repair protein RecO (recombination protein O)
MATYWADVITLSSRRIRDTEALCHFLSRQHGKLEATARGVGKPGSRLAPATEVFTLSRAFFATGRSLDHLTQCEVLEAFYELRTDVRRMGYAGFAAELIDKTTEPGEAHAEVFDLLLATLRALCEAVDPRLTAWAFEVRYLDLMGLGPQIEACVSCGERAPEALVAFSPGLGGTLCRACAGEDDHRAVCQGTLRTFAALRRLGPQGAGRLTADPRVLKELAWLLTDHRRFHVDADIKSARFLANVGPRTEDRGPRTDGQGAH